MKKHGFAEEMLDGLLNLDLALQCDGFVSSINSNWARWVGTMQSARTAEQYGGMCGVVLQQQAA